MVAPCHSERDTAMRSSFFLNIEGCVLGDHDSVLGAPLGAHAARERPCRTGPRPSRTGPDN